MIKHPHTYFEKIASEQELDKIIQSSMVLLRDCGMKFHSELLCDTLRRAGAKVDLTSGRVYFSEEMIQDALTTVPGKWVLHGRSSDKDVVMGNENLLVAPGYGSAFISNVDGSRRYAGIGDLEKFAKLVYGCPEIDITGGIIVEPNDVEIEHRAIRVTEALIRNSDKPFMGSVSGEEAALETIEMARIVMGDIRDKPSVLALININSPMTLDTMMAQSMVEYAMARQPILLTPGIILGITAPVTIAGAAAQAFAEMLACITACQVLSPGCPVMVGLGGFACDLRNATTGFGRPEHALGIAIGTQIARKLKIPFRCSALVTSSRLPDCRSGYERMMTALTAWNCGAHLCLQAAGILDSINSMSYEQFLIDMEIWSYIKRISQPIRVNGQSLAEQIKRDSSAFLMDPHTIENMRQELLTPWLLDCEPFEQWEDDGKLDLSRKAGAKLEDVLKRIQPPPLDKETDKELKKYMKSQGVNVS